MPSINGVSVHVSWHQVVSYHSIDEVRRQTNQPLLTEVIQYPGMASVLVWAQAPTSHMDDNV